MQADAFVETNGLQKPLEAQKASSFSSSRTVQAKQDVTVDGLPEMLGDTEWPR